MVIFLRCDLNACMHSPLRIPKILIYLTGGVVNPGFISGNLPYALIYVLPKLTEY